MAKTIKRELNRYLKELSKPELEKEIQKLYSRIPQVKQYYEMELSEDTAHILEAYKARIRKEYFPNRGFGQARNSVSRKVVSDFKKIAIHQKDVIDLLLYRVENMIEFTSEYGDIDEPFYSSLESSFEEACKLIKKEVLQKEYRVYCQELISKTWNFGWGLTDGLQYSYSKYFK